VARTWCSTGTERGFGPGEAGPFIAGGRKRLGVWHGWRPVSIDAIE